MQAFIIAVIAALLIFVVCLAGTAVGAFAGWIVGFVFDDSLRLLAQALGIEAAPYQLGAIFGFIGSFFRSTLSK